MTRLLFAGPIPDATTDLRRAAAQAGLVTFTCEVDELVANRDPAVDEVVAWLSVADNCLIGTLDPREILAHVAAMERRRHRWASSRIEIGCVAVDTTARLAEVRGRVLPLTGHEYAVLEFLMTRAGRCVTKEMILDHCYAGMDEPDQRTIDVFVSNLRRKLRDAEAPGDLIETVWGRGYLVRRPSTLAVAA